ncbi:MAG: hypothetical protein ACHQIG_04805 [Acidimicrobiia bacterium]
MIESRVTRGEALKAWWSRYWILVALLAFALVMSVVIRHVVYPAYSWNRDEVTYQWQVSVLRGGHLFGADGGFKHLFWPWLTGHNEHGFFSQYTLGWPLVMLAADFVTGSAAASILVGVTALVLGAYALTLELTRDRRLALIATVLVVASPMFAVQSGVYLGYLFSTGIGLLFGASLLAGLRRDDWRLVAVGGALLGYLFLTRPYDAVLWGGAIGVYAVIASWNKWRELVRGTVVAGLCFTPFFVLALVYNRKVTGSFTLFPITAKDPLDTFGWGLRRLMPNTKPYVFTRHEALRGVFRNAASFPTFLVGAWLGVAVALGGLWLRRRDRSTLGLLAVMAVFPYGYLVFWGIRLSSYYAFLSAPLYLIPLYVPVCILIGTVILWLWSSHRAGLCVVLCVVLALVTVPFLLSRLGSNQQISRAQVPWKESSESLPPSSLVFVATNKFLMHLNPYSANAPQLDNTGALYATDHPLGMLGLIAAYPDRTPVLQLTSKPELGDAFHHPHPSPPTIHIVPLKVLTGQEFSITARVKATSRLPIVVSVRVGLEVDTRVVAKAPIKGETYETVWYVGNASPGSADSVIPLPARPAYITVRKAVTADVNRPLYAPHEIQRYSYQPVSGGYQLLTPSRRRYISHIFGNRIWREVRRFPEYHVHAATVG